MAGETKASNLLPVSFYFELDWEGQTGRFEEVAGLDLETPEIEYRRDSDAQLFKHKLPGLRKRGNVVLKRGFMAANSSLSRHVGTWADSEIQRADAKISLMDASGAVLQVWTLKNAWPVKLSVDDVQSRTEIPVKALEFSLDAVVLE